jgi:hypothetical protein
MTGSSRTVRPPLQSQTDAVVKTHTSGPSNKRSLCYRDDAALTSNFIQQNQRGERRQCISDGDDLIGGFQNSLSKGCDVQPFERGALLQQPKVQVETMALLIQGAPPQIEKPKISF